MQLYSTPPPQLTSNQRVVLKRNALLVQRINSRLRRVRRLLTRVEKQHEDMQRRALELQKLGHQYVRLLGELEKKSPAEAAAYRDWLETEFRPAIEPLHDRERVIEEKVERLQRWTEDPVLRQMLKRLRQVTAALQDLRRHYKMSLRP